jgi:tRNA(Glu) U13 pseudouridine synthase TruD
MPRPTPPGLERDVGMEVYLTDEHGIGGRLKTLPEDFVVEEVPLAFPAPSAEGKYTVAALRVRNWETNRLMGELARRLGVPRETIFFAGTKDKRAITTQYVSLRAPEAQVRALDLKDVEVLETRRVDRAPMATCGPPRWTLRPSPSRAATSCSPCRPRQASRSSRTLRSSRRR